MRRVPNLLLLLACFLLTLSARAEEPAWLSDALNQAHSVISMWSHEAKGVAKEFLRHDLKEPKGKPTSGEMPKTAVGETTVVCDGALLFDTDGNNLVYVSNVRLNDSRLQLWARHRLFIRLEKREVDSNRKEVQKSAGGNADRLGKKLDPASAGKQRREATLPEALETVRVESDEAVVDTENNHIILYSPPGGHEIIVRSGESYLRSTTAPDKSATVLLDAGGNILMEGAGLALKWKDREGRVTEMHSSGMAYYNADEKTAVLQGPCSVTHPSGSVSSQERICAALQIEQPAEPHQGFMQQFADVKCHGIARVQAGGPVSAEMTTESGQMTSLSGDNLFYDAEKGLLELTGADCALQYGADTLRGARSVQLLPDGSLHVSGPSLSGTYERPSSAEGAPPVRGSYFTGGEIVFAETGEGAAAMHLPQGINAKDSEGDFSCKGAAQLVFAEDEKVKKPAVVNSNLNLALLRYRLLDKLHAENTVRAHHFIPGEAKPATEVQAEVADADWSIGTATLRGTATQPVLVSHEGNLFIVRGGENSTPTAELNKAGDIALRGGTIDADFVTKEGKAHAHCTEGLDLTRADHKLQTLSATEIRAPQGHLRTNGPVSAVLAVDPKAAEASRDTHPQLSFPYTGLREMQTAQGGTMQSAKGSMRCSGPVRVVMGETTDKDSPYSGLQRAEAHGNVALAAKDSKNKLYNATGEFFSYDAASGEKILSGNTVTLSDEYNTHVASGPNAAVRVDRNNHVRITGATMKTGVNRLRQQLEQQKKPQNKQQ